MSFKEKYGSWAIITGASSGLGVEFAHQLAEKGLNLKIEVETRNIDEVRQVLETGGIDRIMLDNYTPEDMKIAVELINGEYETEASGGIKLDTIRSYAETGVDFISVGALTHSVNSLDISLKAVYN